MADLAIEVVNAIASGAGGRLGAAGIGAASRLVSALRARLRGDTATRGALEIAAEDPRDATARTDLETLLRERLARDAGFSAWLEALWSEVGPGIRAEAGRPANIVSGDVRGNVVQARDVHGGIHIAREELPLGGRSRKQASGPAVSDGVFPGRSGRA